MARPKKTDDKLTKHIDVRLSVAEKDRLELLAKEAGLRPPDYIRLKALGSKPKGSVATPEREIFLKGLAELNKIGSNLNQIARQLNRKADSEGISVPPELLEYSLRGLETLTRHIIENLTPHGNKGTGQG